MKKKTRSKSKQPDIRVIMSDYNKAIPFLSQTPAEAWEGLGIKTAMDIFRETSKNISAYSEFLQLRKINPKKIISFQDFYKIPITDKDNYIQTHGFNEINSVQAGNNLYSFSLSSGTIDEPTIWPRYYQYEEFLPLVFDIFMRLYWQIDTRSTLLINAFAMGPWVAGFTVHSAIRPLTQKHNLTLATTGADVDSIVYTIKKLSKHYDQVVLFSYPTFARTILDQLEIADINLKKLNMKIFIAGEGHTVEWRQYINKLITNDKGNIDSIIDGYGTTDAGLVGMGSALTNLVRDLAYKNEKLRKDLFGKTDSIPTLFQYNPASYFLEEYNSEILFTTKSTTPLVRYNIHDRGGVISFRKVEELLKKHGYNYKKLISEKGLPSSIVWQQPFIYCFGRRDDTVIIGGANVFPEHISPALFNDKIKDIHSFKISTGSDSKQKIIFYVHLELKDGVKIRKDKLKSFKKRYKGLILKRLKDVNMDFADAYRIDPKVCTPIIDVHQSGTGPFTEDVGRTKPKLVYKNK